uniref:Uncharacterized protein n=1 Tax=Noccaea caerulescens TaxID=107243 RepID=A0A1J3FJF0_NOCCA
MVVYFKICQLDLLRNPSIYIIQCKLQSAVVEDISKRNLSLISNKRTIMEFIQQQQKVINSLCVSVQETIGSRTCFLFSRRASRN